MSNILKYQNPSSPLLNPHKIIENIPVREWGPRKINEDYSITEGKGTNFWRAPFQYLGNKGLGVQNEKLARDLISEFDQMRSENPDYNYTLDKNYQSYDDAINYINHLEGLKKYLHLPYDIGLLMESKYKPTRLQGTNEKTYKFRSSMTPGYWDDVVEDMVIGEHDKNQYYDQSLNEFTAYRDRDEKGDFVSIYDEWDYNPAVRGGNKKLNKVIDSVTGGKPFVIYDRVYLDDYYDIPEEARGNPFITPAVVTAYKKGGRIHIKKKNRGKFTAAAKRAGMGVQEFARHVLANKDKYSSTLVKRANFARNSKKFKHENGGILKAQEGTGNGFWSKLWNAVKEGGMAARDAKLGAVGAQQVRDLYSEGKNQEAQDLAKQYAKANTTGIALAGGAASTGLLGDLMVTGATTAADTFIDGDVDNFGKNLLLNAAFDLAGHGVGKLLRNVDWGKVRNSVELIPDNTKADVSEYINTVDDALPERQPLTTNKSKQFWTGTSESKLTDAEKAGIPKGERNQKITTQSQNQEYVKKYLDATTTPKEHTFDINHETIFGNLDVDAFNTNLQDFIKTLPDSDSKFFIDKNIVDGYRNYLDNLDFDASAISDTDLQKFLSHYSETLSNSATGKLKDQLLFHSSPDWFERFDLSHTGKNTENTGVLGPGNYFSKEGDVYGRRFINDGKKQYHYMNNTQPYIITDIKSTPSGYDMQSKGLLPQIIHKYRMRTKGPTGGIFSDPDPSFDLKLKQLIDNTPVNDNKAYIIPSTSDARPALYKINGVFDGGEVMIRRNTGIKSIYPHPSRLVRTADGVVTLKPVDWSDVRVNFKQGGKL